MSNLGAYGSGAKNAPWSRTAQPNNIMNTGNTLQQQMISQSGISNLNSNIVSFQQPQVFQSMGVAQQNLGLALPQMNAGNSTGNIPNAQIASNQLFQQVSSVTYPNPRALNVSAFQTAQQQPQQQQQQQKLAVSNAAGATTATQRVFTGTVTTVHDNFGFVDEDVFFQMSACVGGTVPMVGDKVLVEALFNSRMPFKWNATRIQVLSMGSSGGGRPGKSFPSISQNNYPPVLDSDVALNRGNRNKVSSSRIRERSRDKEHEEDEVERKRRREERIREREKDEEKSPLRRRSRSPKSRRRSRIVPRYMVQIPKIALDLKIADVLEVRRRYANLYVPSDFFSSHFRWLDAFPPDKPFALSKPCSFHILSKDVEPLDETEVPEPTDADYLFSAKVMLMSVCGIEEMYQKCCNLAESKDRRNREGSEDRDCVHPTRMINFLVGLRGKNETMAIGGPWSPSLDGANPEKDPAVLIRTAIRTCKSLTGIDLSNCTKWYRFVELYYRRGDSNHRGKPVAARVETVVVFLPDIWSCLPTRLEWDSLQANYRKKLERKLRPDHEHSDDPDEAQACTEKDETAEDKVEPTHYSQLDPKVMLLADLKRELKARSVSATGLKSQLVARLTKLLKSEAAKNDENIKEDPEDVEVTTEEKTAADENNKIDEKERQQLEKKYTLPEMPHVLVHPSRTAKSGKFDCTVMSLSLLLDYRPEDTKEHSFEVSLFAELFNEMLMRDFGFNIYKSLYNLPEKKKKEPEKKKDKDGKTKEEDESSKEKKETTKSDNESDDEDDDHGKDRSSSKDRKKKRERPKMFTKDRNLLLSFVYFDQTHCGYIFEKDIEDLLHTLGLNLSRAQVRKLVSKVITRDSLHYRKLTDKTKEEDFIVIDDTEKDGNLYELAVGNKNLLPVFKGVNDETENDTKTDSEANTEEALINYNGALIDVQKLLLQLDRSEKARLDIEKMMVDLKAVNSKLSDKASKYNSTIKNLNSELKENKEKLRSNESMLKKANSSQSLYESTLLDIKSKIEGLFGSTSSTKTAKEEIKEEAKSRWEQDAAKSNSENEVQPISVETS